MLAAAGNTAGGPAMRHARARLLRRRAANCRRRRRTRRSRTTAPASTAACSRTASNADCRRRPTLRFDHPLQQAIRRAVAHFTGVAGGRRSSRASTAARRRTTRCRSPRSRWRFARLAADATDAAYGDRAAQIACRRDDRASRNGLGRAPQRPGADAGRARRLGRPRSAPRACRRSACAARASASRSRSPTAASAGCIPRSSRSCDAAGTARRDTRARDCAPWREPIDHATTAGIATGRGPSGRCPGQTMSGAAMPSE